jgi:ABC-type lipoprotein export system ATPase subunit
MLNKPINPMPCMSVNIDPGSGYQRMENPATIQPINPSMWYWIGKSLCTRDMIVPFFGIVVVIVMQGWVNYLMTIHQFTIQHTIESRDINQVTRWFGIMALLLYVRRFSRTALSHVVDNYARAPIERKINQQIRVIQNSSSLDWMRKQDMRKMEDAVNEGIGAAVNVASQSFYLFIPLFQSFSSIYVVIQQAGPVGLIGLLSSVIILGMGMYLTRRDFNERKQTNKDISPYRDNRMNMAMGFFASRINGTTDQMIEKLTHSATQENSLSIKQYNKRRWYYAGLEFLLQGFLFVNILVIIQTTPLDKIYPMWLALGDASWTMWDLFFTCNHIITLGAKWGSLEEVLETCGREPDVDKVEMTDNTLEELIPGIKGFHQMIRISGKSGTGKTTFMKNLVVKMYRRYTVDWIWMEQDTFVTDELIGVQMLSGVPQALWDDDLYLLMYEWAGRLGINQIICREKIGEKFQNPSGGEKKRITLLRLLMFTLYKIKKGLHVPRFIVVDEPCAGLDNDTWMAVQSMFNHMTKHKIRIIFIDHHDGAITDIVFEARQVKKLQDAKVSDAKVSDAKVKGWWERMVSAYVTEKKNNEKSDPPEVELHEVRLNTGHTCKACGSNL